MTFGPYTAVARAAVESAEAEARGWGHAAVSTSHLLLGLAARGMAGAVLHSLGLSPAVIRRDVRKSMSPGFQAVPERVPYSAEARRALELAFEEHHSQIGTDHLLLGLLREGGLAADVLGARGFGRDQVRSVLAELRPSMCYGCAEYGADPTEAVRTPEIEFPAWLTDLDGRLADVRRRKESAVDAEDYARAARIRDDEKELIRRRADLIRQHSAEFDLVAALDEISRLRAYAERLRAALRHDHAD